MRTVLLLVTLGFACSLGFGCSCEEDDTQPSSVLRRFLQAAADGDIEVVFGLLTPDVQSRLRKLASLATAQSGGRHRYRPSDLLATTLTPRGRTFSIKVLSENKQRAELQASAPKTPAEIWHLRRIEGRWRVVLTARALGPPAAGPEPAKGDLSSPKADGAGSPRPSSD